MSTVEPTAEIGSRASTAALIRAALKAELGITRQVSVRNERMSLSTSVHVEIKDAAVSLAKVEAIADRFEKVHRCEVSGEILGGGNTFVSVNYSREALTAGGAPYLAAVEAAKTELASAPRDTHAQIAGTAYSLSLAAVAGGAPLLALPSAVSGSGRVKQ